MQRFIPPEEQRPVALIARSRKNPVTNTPCRSIAPRSIVRLSLYADSFFLMIQISFGSICLSVARSICDFEINHLCCICDRQHHSSITFGALCSIGFAFSLKLYLCDALFFTIQGSLCRSLAGFFFFEKGRSTT